MKSQAAMILDLLRERGEAGVMLTDVQGEPIWCERLAARIHDIRRGMLMADEEIADVGHTTARGKRVARYVLRRIDYSWAGREYDGRDGSLEITQAEEDAYSDGMDAILRSMRA